MYQNVSCSLVGCTVNRCVLYPIVCLLPNKCLAFLCNTTTNNTCFAVPTGIYTFDKCGVCGGNGFSCIPLVVGQQKNTSIIVALAVGLSCGLVLAAIVIGILTRKGYASYAALATECQGGTTVSSVYTDPQNTFVPQCNTDHH